MTVPLRSRVLLGVLLSFIWIGANLAFAGSTATAENASTFSEAFRVRARPIPIRVAPETTLSPPATHIPPTSPAGAITIPARHASIPTRLALDINREQMTGTVPPPPEYVNSMTGQQYRYFERSQEVTDLQIELGMQSVDGVYGPKTRKAHVESLGGPHTLLYRNYPEFGQVLTPCSHECEPGDGHYELPTLGELINEYFKPEDRVLALKIAFCESSGQAHHIGSDVVSSALAVGWFQHLAKYWGERSEKAGWGDYHPFHGRANVAVASWLFYSSGIHHWNPSRHCWGPTAQPPTTTSTLPPSAGA